MTGYKDRRGGFFARLLAPRGEDPRFINDFLASRVSCVADAGGQDVTIRAKSRDPHFCFAVTIRVHYRDPGRALEPDHAQAVANDAMRGLVLSLSQEQSLSELEDLRIILESRLPRLRKVQQGDIWARATDVLVDADEKHLDAAVARQEFQMAGEVNLWRGEADLAQSKHVSEVLADPLRSTAWWLAKHPGDVDRLPAVCESFIEVSRQLLDEREGGDDLNRAVLRLWKMADAAGRSGLVNALQQFAANYGFREVIQDLERIGLDG